MIRSVKDVSCNRLQIHHFCWIPTHPNLTRAFLALLLKEERKKEFPKWNTLWQRWKFPFCGRDSYRNMVLGPHILGMLFQQIVLLFALDFYVGQVQTTVSAEGPSLLSVSLCPCILHCCITAFEGPLLHLAQYFLPDISTSCKNLIFLISIPSSNFSKSPLLLLSSTALRMLPSLVPSVVLINLQFASSPRTLIRIFSNGSSKLILRLAWIIKSFLQLDSNSFCSQ